jgi:hypothetical protein
MPEGWELGAFTRSRNIKTANDLLPVVFKYLTNTPSFGKTAAILRLGEDIHLNKNAVYGGKGSDYRPH